MAWKRGLSVLGGAAVAGALLLAPAVARAQDTGNPVSPTGKGIAGGILLGAEIVMIPLGAAGVDAWWPYAVFTPLAAAGGGVGGYFIEKAITDAEGTAEAPLYMLAGGIGLVIPALVLTLNATAYNPAEDEYEDEEELPAAPAEPGTPAAPNGGVTPAGPPPPAAPAGPTGPTAPQGRAPRGLFDLAPGRLALGLPPVGLRPAYSEREIFLFGAKQTAELHIPVVAGSF
ncbi:MAG: hypothetical protein IT373_35445 [Polyangiaceae bacterium]|nr:hypothetical protein [Polyangiaceae bacterium]